MQTFALALTEIVQIETIYLRFFFANFALKIIKLNIN